MRSHENDQILQFKPGFADSFFRPISDAERIYGKSKLRHIREIVQYCFYERLFTRADYYLYGFNKTARVSPEKARRYVGYTRNEEILRRVNRKSSVGCTILRDKILTEIVMRTLGIPTQPILAAYRPSVSGFGGELLISSDDISEFLRKSDNYPIFGKPSDGVFSSGAISLDSYCAESDSVVKQNGAEINVEKVANEISAGFPAGYIFQKQIKQHPEISAISGNVVSSVRMFTINDGKEPIIHYAIWKIASPDSIADNSWRPNIASCLVDLMTGRTTRAAVRCNGVSETTEYHPTLGIPIVGLELPMWSAVKGLALDAAKQFADLPIVGWDIALCEEGPIIIEGNEYPGPSLYQTVMEDGVLSEQFLEIISRIESEKKSEMTENLGSISRIERYRARLRKFDLAELFR